MIRVSARVNVNGVAGAFERRARGARGATMVALEEAGTIVQAEAQRLILDGPKTGKVYQKYSPRRQHQASAPGQPPANDLGFLAANIVLDRVLVPSGRIIIASLAPYSRGLEFGTRFMRQRSFMRRAIANTRGAVITAFVVAYRRQSFR